VFGTLEGDQHSNDHYPYYELVIPLDGSELAISSYQWFFEDIAGLEGLNWLAVSCLLFVYLLGPIAIAFGIIRGIWRFFARRRMRVATNSDGKSFSEEKLDTLIPKS
jgi:hypothetical protein